MQESRMSAELLSVMGCCGKKLQGWYDRAVSKFSSRFPQPIRILSDLHLGSPQSKIDEIATLAPLLEGARTVIFNGDTREERVPELRGRSEEAYHELVELCESLGADPIFLCGNHDPQISEHHYLDLCEGRFFVTHGDMLFPMITPWSCEIDEIKTGVEEIHERYGKAAENDLGLAVERLKEVRHQLPTHSPSVRGNSSLERFIWSAFELWPPRRVFDILSIWRKTPHLAREFLRMYRPSAECVIIGHTHRCQVSTDQEPHFMNTGAFASGLGQCLGEIDQDRLWSHRVGRRRKGGAWFLGGRRAIGSHS